MKYLKILLWLLLPSLGHAQDFRNSTWEMTKHDLIIKEGLKLILDHEKDGSNFLVYGYEYFGGYETRVVYELKRGLLIGAKYEITIDESVVFIEDKTVDLMTAIIENLDSKYKNISSDEKLRWISDSSIVDMSVKELSSTSMEVNLLYSPLQKSKL